MSLQPPIGIDLGTTNSVIGTVQNDEFEILGDDLGNRKTPSVVSHDWETDEVYVGRRAANRAISNPDSTIRSIKRYMGEEEEFHLGRETYRPEEISALILKKLVRGASETLGTQVTNAVITVPAYFGEHQRKATKVAGEIAGIEVDRIITEPTAACLAYGLHAHESKTVFVYDLGGGTFDCSVVDISDGFIDVQGVGGKTDLGGDDYDGLIVNWILDHIESEHGTRGTLENPELEARLFEAAKDAKHELTSRQSTTISLPYLELGNGQTVNVEVELTRDKFEDLATGPTDETLSECEDILQETSTSVEAIDEVLLVGGSTRMPIIRNNIQRFFGQAPRTGVNPDEVVALGAAAQAALIQDIPLPAASTTNALPATHSDEEGAIIGQDSKPALLDVLPQCIGAEMQDLETKEHYYEVIIGRGESIPTRESISTIPIEDFQTRTTFSIYQGDSGDLDENLKLDEFTLGPYPPREREEQEHTLEIEIDESGILHARAVDENHDVEEQITVETEFALTDSEIDKMKDDLPALHD